MPTKVADYPNVRRRIQALGGHAPSSFALLPTNFDTATCLDDFRQVAEAATVKTLFRSADIPYSDVTPSDQRPPYIQNNTQDWVGPTIFVSAALISQNPHLVDVALSLISNYLTVLFRGQSGKQEVTLEVVVEIRDDAHCRKLSYTGPPEGLRDIPDAVRSIAHE